jgi:hypothetical protein
MNKLKQWVYNQFKEEIEADIAKSLEPRIADYWAKQHNKYARLLDKIDNIYSGTDGDIYVARYVRGKQNGMDFLEKKFEKIEIDKDK